MRNRRVMPVVSVIAVLGLLATGCGGIERPDIGPVAAGPALVFSDGGEVVGRLRVVDSVSTDVGEIYLLADGTSRLELGYSSDSGASWHWQELEPTKRITWAYGPRLATNGSDVLAVLTEGGEMFSWHANAGVVTQLDVALPDVPLALASLGWSDDQYQLTGTRLGTGPEAGMMVDARSVDGDRWTYETIPWEDQAEPPPDETYGIPVVDEGGGARLFVGGLNDLRHGAKLDGIPRDYLVQEEATGERVSLGIEALVDDYLAEVDAPLGIVDLASGPYGTVAVGQVTHPEHITSLATVVFFRPSDADTWGATILEGVVVLETVVGADAVVLLIESEPEAGETEGRERATQLRGQLR